VIFAPTYFGSRRNHHQGAVLYLAKTTSVVFIVLVGTDVSVCGSCCEPHTHTIG
jgi:hypothetical protein